MYKNPYICYIKRYIMPYGLNTSTELDLLPDELILKKVIDSLNALLEEDREAKEAQAAREVKIKKARFAVELFSNGKTYEEIIGESPNEEDTAVKMLLNLGNHSFSKSL